MEKEEMLDMRLKGSSYQEIASAAGISRQRVHQKLTGYRPKNFQENRRNWKRKWSKTESGKKSRNKTVQQYRVKSKVIVLTYYGNGRLACVRCGFNDIRALSIDHINGGGANHKRKLHYSGSIGYRWYINQNFPPGYQTLCMNCQWIKRFENNENKAKI